MFRKVFLIVSLCLSIFAQAKDYYVKTDGTGNGSSWADAMSPRGFAEEIPTAEEGSTFHLAAGTYYPESEQTVETWKGIENFKSFVVGASISIIGGYSQNPEDGEIPNPDKNITLFSADYNNDDEISHIKSYYGTDSIVISNTTDNEKYLFIISNDYVTFSLYGVQIAGAKEIAIYENEHLDTDFLFTKTYFYNNTGSIIDDYYTKSIIIDSCIFKHNGTREKVGAVLSTEDVQNCTINNSHFEENGNYASGGCITVQNLSMKNTTMIRNYSREGCVSDYGRNESYIYNCTFIENKSKKWVGAFYSLGKHVIVLNNTFAGNYIFLRSGSADNLYKAGRSIDFIGNLVVDGTIFSSTMFSGNVTDSTFNCRHNIFTTYPHCVSSVLPYTEFNLIIPTEEMAELIGGKTDTEGNISLPSSFFEASEENKVLKLKKDILSDSTSIRFARSGKHRGLEHFTSTDNSKIDFPPFVGIPTTDARGTARCELTCPGAYEIRNCDVPLCTPDTTLLSTPDTIQVGENFLDQTFSTVGRHDSIFERLKSADGCDSLVMHRVVVKEGKTDIEDITSISLQIYPNPAKEEITIFGGRFSNFEIIDIFGRIVLKGEISKQKIDISSLNSGVYLIRCNNKNITFVKN